MVQKLQNLIILSFLPPKLKLPNSIKQLKKKKKSLLSFSLTYFNTENLDDIKKIKSHN